MYLFIYFPNWTIGYLSLSTFANNSLVFTKSEHSESEADLLPKHTLFKPKVP